MYRRCQARKTRTLLKRRTEKVQSAEIALRCSRHQSSGHWPLSLISIPNARFIQAPGLAQRTWTACRPAKYSTRVDPGFAALTIDSGTAVKADPNNLMPNYDRGTRKYSAHDICKQSLLRNTCLPVTSRHPYYYLSTC